MNLERAIEIAVEAHKGARDKAGNPYVLHPLRMMFAVNTEEEKIVAVLHDVVEDEKEKGWDFDRLQQEGFSRRILAALKSVTKERKNENYDRFINRALRNPIGRQVKIADIKDNLDVTRLKSLTERDVKRLNKYKRALARLREPG